MERRERQAKVSRARGISYGMGDECRHSSSIVPPQFEQEREYDYETIKSQILANFKL